MHQNCFKKNILWALSYAVRQWDFWDWRAPKCVSWKCCPHNWIQVKPLASAPVLMAGIIQSLQREGHHEPRPRPTWCSQRLARLQSRLSRPCELPRHCWATTIRHFRQEIQLASSNSRNDAEEASKDVWSRAEPCSLYFWPNSDTGWSKLWDEHSFKLISKCFSDCKIWGKYA